MHYPVRHLRLNSILLLGVLFVPCAFSQTVHDPLPSALDDARIQVLGRSDRQNPLGLRFGYPGSGLRFRFEGKAVLLLVSSDTDKNALTIVVDHGDPALVLTAKGDNTLAVASDLDPGSHTIEIYKRSNSSQGILTFKDIQFPEGGLLEPSPLPTRHLLFIGDSVTCGVGVENNSVCRPDLSHPANDPYNSYGMLLSRRLDAQVELVCYPGRGLVRDYRGLTIADGVPNAPQFFDLSIAADDPTARSEWNPLHSQPDLIVVSLGTNDFNLERSKPIDPQTWVADYVAFVRSLRKTYPVAKIMLTEGAIVTDPRLRQMVEDTVTAAADKQVSYVPSNHYPGNGCDGHPTRQQHIRMADDFEPAIRKLMGW